MYCVTSLGVKQQIPADRRRMHRTTYQTASAPDPDNNPGKIENALESLSNVFYLLRTRPENAELVRLCTQLGSESLDQLIREIDSSLHLHQSDL
ncbi:MAG: hypothetical protein NVSMB62_20570 [Acidobacteriaceae bacterium]